MHSEKIVSAKRIGIRPTMDITIDSDDHIFFANGLATSNSHSVAYSALTAQELWLKNNYFVEYMAALLNNTKIGDKKHGSDNIMGDYINYCRGKGTAVFPPDVSKSKMRFSVENKSIRYSLSHIKGVSSSAEIIVKHQPYTSMKDFVDRCFEMLPAPGNKLRRHGPNTKVVESLIMAGAFKEFGGINDNLREYYKLKKKKEEPALIGVHQAKMEEKELLGAVLSENPLVTRFNKEIEEYKLQTITGEAVKKNVRVLCQVERITKCTSKAGKDMFKVDLSDGVANMKMFVWDADRDFFAMKFPEGTIGGIPMSRFEDEVPFTDDEKKVVADGGKVKPKKKVGPRFFLKNPKEVLLFEDSSGRPLGDVVVETSEQKSGS
jgi:DNA polymerase III alpha subunit